MGAVRVPKSANEIIEDKIVTHGVNILRVEESQRRDVLAALTELEGELVGKVAANTAGGVGGLNAARLNVLLRQTQKTIKSTYDLIAANQGKSLAEIAELSADKTNRIVSDTINAAIKTVGLSTEQAEAIAGKALIEGRYPAEYWADHSAQLQAKFAAQMRNGMFQGEGFDDLARRVRGTRAKAYTDGIMQLTKSQAQALVRTSVQTVANDARIAMILKNGNVVKAIKWVATLDSRTTPICRALDGKTWTIPDFKPIGHDKRFPGSTAHWQCRSTQVPVTKSWKELAGPGGKTKTAAEKADAMEKAIARTAAEKGLDPAEVRQAVTATRASMDGQVPATKDFQGWLEGKSDSFQNDLLGPAKAKLWKSGKLTVSDMTDQTNRPLSVKELRAMVETDTDISPKREGENGLSLAARALLKDALQYGEANKATLATYLSETTGETVAVPAVLPSVEAAGQIAELEKLHVVQNVLSQGEAWTAAQIGLFGKLENFIRASAVDPSGRVATLTIKRGQTFTEKEAADLVKRIRTSRAKVPMDAVREAVAATGKLTLTFTPEGIISASGQN